MTYRLRGYDTFAGDWYLIEGEYPTDIAAITAALDQLDQVEALQPTASSGGQYGGIQDQIWVICPDGSQFRVFPHHWRVLKNRGE
jgi:hypothetical protein